jgi:tripartite ATP-independent transporter DctM subunit
MIDLTPATGQFVVETHGKPGRATAIERAVIVLLTLGMVLVPVLEILMRKIHGQGLGLGPITQRLGVWLGFVGAIVATAMGKHLGLATTTFLKPKNPARRIGNFASGAVSSATAMMLVWASWQTVKADRGSTDMLPGGIPTWVGETIMPIAFACICARFIWHTPGTRRWGAFGHWVGRLSSLGACLLTLALIYVGKDHPHAFLWPGVFIIVGAFLLGAPVFVAMAGLAMLLFFTAESPSPISSVPQATLQLMENPTLPAIPLLTIAGYVLAAGKASQRLVRAYKSLFGWLPGGVALMVISVCALFTTLTGGSGVTILALGGIMYPALVNDGYPDGFSVGLVTAAGSLGLLFPPSLPVILYSAVLPGDAGVSAKTLYLGGLVPGVVLMIVIAIYAVRIGMKANAPRQKFETKEAVAALWAAKYDLLLPVLVLLVLGLGIGLVVEAAAIGALYALLIELFVFRDVDPLREMPTVLVQAATLVGSVVVLMGVAYGLTNYLVDQEVPTTLLTWVQTHIHTQWGFLLALNAILLVLGSVFEIYAAIIVLAPLIAPMGMVFNIEPVHLGVVFLANLELGFLFPPMGLNLFLSASRFGRPLPYLYRQALPFLLFMALGVLLITYVPAMTTGVVHLFAK